MSDQQGPMPCGAVFRSGENAPTSCALRFNHLGPHRHWIQVADDREDLLGALEELWSICLSCAPAIIPDPPMDKAMAAIAKAKGKS